MRRRPPALLLLALLPALAAAQHKCVDAQGRIVYQQWPCAAAVAPGLAAQPTGTAAPAAPLAVRPAPAAPLAGRAAPDGRDGSGEDRSLAARKAAEAGALLDEWQGDRALLDAARSLLEQALRASTRVPATYRELARYHIMAGVQHSGRSHAEALVQAEQALGQALALDPNFAEAHVLAGHLYRKLQRPAEARRALQTAEALGTHDPWLHSNWADLLIDEGRYEEALARYRRLLADRSAKPKAVRAAYDGLAKVHTRLGRLDDADQAHRDQLRHSPDSAWAHGNYAGFLLCHRDDAEAAIREARRARELMDYGVARWVQAAALARRWADQVRSGAAQPAATTAREVATLGYDTPLEAIETFCKAGGNAVRSVRQAAAEVGLRR